MFFFPGKLNNHISLSTKILLFNLSYKKQISLSICTTKFLSPYVYIVLYYPCFYLSPFNCVIDQGRVGRWIEHAGDRDFIKQQVKWFLWFHSPSLLVHWWNFVFCPCPIQCCILRFCHCLLISD